MLVLPAIAIVLGLILLVWSADRFVHGAAAIAHNFGVSHMVIGLTIVALGTSAPEMLVSTLAALNDSMPIALGNALGSNTANVGLVLGVTALISRLPVQRKVLQREGLMLLLATLACTYFMWNLDLSRTEGFLLFSGLFVFIGWTVGAAIKNPDPASEELEDLEEEIPVGISNLKAFMWFAVGLAVLAVSAQMLVYGAVEVATAFGVSEIVIGATIVAIGTSLPELAASVAAARKGHTDIAIGNVIGSNLFNLLAVVGIATTIAPGPIESSALSLHMSYTLGTTILMLLASIWIVATKKALTKPFGVFLLALYASYIYLNL